MDRVRPRALEFGCPTVPFRDTPADSETPRPRSVYVLSIRSNASESVDAPENLPKESPRQGAFGELQDEVPGVSDQTPTGLEGPLLEARQGPALDRRGQDQPAQQIAEVIGDDAQEQPDLVGPEPMTGEARRVGGFFALLDPLLRRPALIVEADDGAVPAGQGGDDEAHPRQEFPEMMLDLGITRRGRSQDAVRY